MDIRAKDSGQNSKTFIHKKDLKWEDIKCLSTRSLSRNIKEFKVRLSKQHELEIENATFNIEVIFQAFKHPYLSI